MEKKVMSISFSEEEKEEFSNIVLEKLQKGISCNEIARYIGISARSIQRIRDRLIKEGKITVKQIDEARTQKLADDKEHDEKRQIILKGLREGKNYQEISKDVGYTGEAVSRLARELIQDGRISKSEIDEARERRGNQKDILRQKVLELLKEGKTNKIIERITGVSYRTISRIKDELIQNGRITQEEIDEAAKVADTNETLEDETENMEIDDNLKEKALELFLQGLVPNTICKRLGVNSINEIKKILIHKKRITQEEIKRARTERRNEDKENVFLLLLNGYSQREIMAKINNGELEYIQGLIRELIEEGRITKEQINRYKFENNEEADRKYILRMLRQGYSIREIAEQDENRIFVKRTCKKT